MRVLSTFIFLLIINITFAQSFEEKFRAFQNEAINKYQSFRDNANKQYADFLRGAWDYYKSKPIIPRPKEEPVPPVIYEEDKEEKEEEVVVIEEPIIIPAPEPQPEPIEPIKPEPKPIERTFKFSFFKTLCEVRIPENLLKLSGLDNEAIANGWEFLSKGEFDVTLYDCLQLREKMNLCDWAYLLLLKEFSTNVYQATNNESVLLTAWLYCQSGYQMRLALDEAKLHLLYASPYVIYDQSYYQIDGYNYYSLFPMPENLQICSAAFENENVLSLQVPNYPNLSKEYSTVRTLKSERYRNIQVETKVNRNLIEFYNTYPSSEIESNPLTRWAMYANTPLTDDVKKSIYPVLEQQIKGLSKRDAVEKLLNFVQTAFVYKLDDEVWGGDRALFAEETLYYPYADCEDRSILFSRLVRDLLGLPVVLVYYPGHLATAVAFPTAEKGDCIILKDRRFTICDPTYIGALVGETMPDMDNKAAHVILLN